MWLVRIDLSVLKLLFRVSSVAIIITLIVNIL
jgi:hypothetical protein